MANSRALFRTDSAQADVVSKLGRLRGINTMLADLEPARARLVDERTVFIASAWAAGATQMEIAEAAGITNARVSQLISAHTRRLLR